MMPASNWVMKSPVSLVWQPNTKGIAWVAAAALEELEAKPG
eukprot:CAMPEP_0194310068 /NCGR_PEP_ID=MMETSP0171-20130528/7015_1 /TAXON_ID=218684 /ORGANISM="Corethron pennatum, Strain L29A3" /LENGTH=40 /DNA_ID= /DNA_START= /DNA_END= /DNA_ORIENTATION=